MQYGRLSGNSSINDRIYACFDTLDPHDVMAFVRKFRRDSDGQNFHTYRELLLGSNLRQCGWKVRYEQAIFGRTPDWLVPPDSAAPNEIVDVVTMHQKRKTDIEIGNAVYADQVWSGWLTIPSDHVLSKLDFVAAR